MPCCSMKFYVVFDKESGCVCGCEFTLRDAKKVGRELGNDFSVTMTDQPVNAESLRSALAGDLGGAARQLKFYDFKP